MWHASSHSGVVLVAKTAICFLTLSYSKNHFMDRINVKPMLAGTPDQEWGYFAGAVSQPACHCGGQLTHSNKGEELSIMMLALCTDLRHKYTRVMVHSHTRWDGMEWARDSCC